VTGSSGSARYGPAVALTNWAGNYAYRARAVHAPETLDELREIVACAERVRVLGSRHSFSGIADSEELISLERLGGEVVVNRGASTVTVGGSVRYGELAAVLMQEQLALANMASLPHIAVAGAVSTATHGSGDHNGNLATSVAGLEIVTSDGGVVTASRGDPEFDGLVVGLGALGAVTRLVLDVEPAYEIAQRVFQQLSWEALLEHFDVIMSSGYSVSVFTRWGDAADQVWVKSRGDEGRVGKLFGASPASVDVHPIAGLDPINCTPQLGLPGPWAERLPHFRMGFTPSAGAEIQSEYIVTRDNAVAAISAILEVASILGPLVQVSEIRTIAADSLWMSPEYGRDSVSIHFTWEPDAEAVRAALERIERALAPLGARPHWGKLFLARAEVIGPLYPRLDDYAALVERLDPRGAFRNEWLETRVLGAPRRSAT
jgi:alditol oxidase